MNMGMHPVEKRRKLMLMSISDLCAHAGLSLGTISSIENGTAPSEKSLVALSRALGVSADRLEKEIQAWSR